MVGLSPPSLLLLAAQISVLTYHIGVLIYLAPLPLRGLKKWAPILIQDSIWAVILVALFSTLLYLSDIVASWSGFSVRDIIVYAKVRLNTLLAVQLIFRIITMFTSIALSAFNKVLSFFIIPLTLNFYALIMALSIVIILASIVASTKAGLAALGIALMALPFRLGRNAGASLLAFSLVANAMLPYLPLWISFFYQGLLAGYTESLLTANTSTYTSYNIWGLVYGESNTWPHGGLIFFNNTDSDTVFIFRIRSDGGYYIIPPYFLPNGTYIVYIEFLGEKIIYDNILKIPNNLKLTYEIEEAPYRLDIRLKNVVFLDPDLLLESIDCSQISVNTDTSSQSLITCTPVSNYVKITIYSLATCTVGINVEDGNIYARTVYTESWRGIRVKIYTIGVYGGIGYPIKLELEKSGQCRVNWDNIVAGKIIQNNAEKSSGFEDLIYLIVYLTALPIAIFSFLSIMSLIIIAVARTLGASYSKVIFEF